MTRPRCHAEIDPSPTDNFDGFFSTPHAQAVLDTLVYDAENLAAAVVCKDRRSLDKLLQTLTDNARKFREGATAPEEADLIHSVTFTLGDGRTVTGAAIHPILSYKKHGIFMARVHYQDGNREVLASGAGFTNEEAAAALAEDIKIVWEFVETPETDGDLEIKTALESYFTFTATAAPGEKA